MRKNLGKVFEQNFKKSIPNSPHYYYYRIKDSATSYYGGNDNLRFSQNNIADAFLLYTNPEYSTTFLYILELKHHKGKSLPINCIRQNQLEEMYKASSFISVVPLLIVFFSDVERCFAIRIEEIYNFEEEQERKSIPITYFEEKGIEIEVEKLRTNYRYNIKKLMEDL